MKFYKDGEEFNTLDYLNNDQPVCPHCDAAYELCGKGELHEEGTVILACMRCGNKFRVEVEQKGFEYTSYPVEFDGIWDWENGLEEDAETEIDM